jgi:hypothetical protein
VSPRAGLDVCEKSRPSRDFFFRPPDRPARSQLLYRLSYPAHREQIDSKDEGPEGEKMYISTLSLTSRLGGEGGQRHVLAALPPGKTRYPLYRRLGGSQGRPGRVREIVPHRDSIPGPSST